MYTNFIKLKCLTYKHVRYEFDLNKIEDDESFYYLHYGLFGLSEKRIAQI